MRPGPDPLDAESGVDVSEGLLSPLLRETNPSQRQLVAQWQRRALDAAGDARAALDLAGDATAEFPLPGENTALRWALLTGVAGVDLTVARTLEAHLDAVAILAEADERHPSGSWGVFAAEGPAATVRVRDGRMSGEKPWCSLAGLLDSALVTAHSEAGRRLYAVDLHHPGVTPAPISRWVSRGLTAVPSGPVSFDDVPVRAVGEPGWYLERPGFARGGMGVAACWLGAATSLADAVISSSRDDDVAALQAGQVDVVMHAAAAVLGQAAAQVDGGTDDAVLAARVRSVVAAAAERTLHIAGHALGPVPLTFDDDHARRVADLTVYLRQHHGERDLLALGRTVRAAVRPPRSSVRTGPTT